jgi:hypothetical protein
MRKIFAIILCAMLMCAMPFVTYASEVDSAPVDETTTETENLPSTDENATEGEKSSEIGKRKREQNENEPKSKHARNAKFCPLRAIFFLPI